MQWRQNRPTVCPGGAAAIAALMASSALSACTTHDSGPAAAPKASGSVEAAVPSALKTGDSIGSAIVLPGVTDEITGVPAEYAYIREHYPGWLFQGQALIHENGRHYDMLLVVGPNGEKRSVYFDITDWYGKFRRPLPG